MKMDCIQLVAVISYVTITISSVYSADFALVGELNVLSVGSHISMAPMKTLDFKSLELGSIGDPLGIDFDPVESKIYWTDYKKGTITRSRLNGGNRQIIFSNAQGPHGITIDKEDRVVYWTEEDRHSIWRSNLDGKNRSRVISFNLEKPGDLQLDPVDKRLYWVDMNGLHSKIESAKVDGTDRKSLVVNTKRLWLKHPTGISLDIVERKMYWCDDKLDYIGSANLDGTNTMNLFAKSSWLLPDLMYQPESIAVYGNNVYFVELMGFQIQRMPKDGSAKPRKVGLVDSVMFVPYGPLQGPVDLFIHADIDYCSKSPCKQDGQCTGDSGWYRCVCVPGTTGPLCEEAAPLISGEMEPNTQVHGVGGASVGGIFGGLLIVVLIIVMIAVICYRRGRGCIRKYIRGDARQEGDNIPIVFATGNQSEPEVTMGGATAAPQKSKEWENEKPEKCQDLGACGFSAEEDDPPSYQEATRQSSKKKPSDFEQLIID